MLLDSTVLVSGQAQRTTALVLIGSFARLLWAPDYPWGSTEEEYRQEEEGDQQLFLLPRDEAERNVIQFLGGHEEEGRLLADYMRHSASPGAVLALSRMNKEIDVRHVLPAIRVPTLMIHGRTIISRSRVPSGRRSRFREPV